MNRIIFTIITALSVIAVKAQTTQPGIVQEYNEKSKKTPLAGVEVRAKSANNAASGKDGKFELQFLTLKPGDKVNVSRIEKLGYEIFNKEAVEQWNINPKTPFVVVMCKSDKFKKIRDNYEAKASENYNKQYKKEIANLNKLKEEGKIKDEEYRKSLQEIQSTYDKQLENLENYVDRFARIDLSEISSQEQEIIELVQQGRFEEAIAKYDELNYKDLYLQQLSEIKELSFAIDQLNDLKKNKQELKDSILAAVSRQIETLKLIGGKDNNVKISNLYTEIATADTTNVEWLLNTAEFLSNYLSDFNEAKYYINKAFVYVRDNFGEKHPLFALVQKKSANINYLIGGYKTALVLYKVALSIEKNCYGADNPIIADTYNDLGNAYLMLEDYSSAFDCYQKALSILEKNYGLENPLIASLYIDIGKAYQASDDYNLALDNFSKSLELYNNLQINNLDVARLYNYMGSVFANLNDTDMALHYYNKALSLTEKIVGSDNPNVTDIYNNIASLYWYLGDYSKAKDYYVKAIEISKNIYGPDNFIIGLLHKKLALTDFLMNNYGAALENYVQALKIYKSCLANDKSFKELCDEIYDKLDDFELLIKDNFTKETLDNYSTLMIMLVKHYNQFVRNQYVDLYDSEKFLNLYERAIFILQTLVGNSDKQVASLLGAIGRMNIEVRRYDQAIKFLLAAEKAMTFMNESYPEEYEVALAELYMDIAETYCKLNDYKTSNDYFSKSIDLYDKIVIKKPQIFPSYRKAVYNAFTYLEFSHELFPEAMKYLRMLKNMEPNNFRLYEREFFMLYRFGHQVEAENIFKEFLSKHSDYPHDLEYVKRIATH